MEEFKKGDLVEPNGKWEYWWNEFKPWPKRVIYVKTGEEPLKGYGFGVDLEELTGGSFQHQLLSSGFRLSKEDKVLKILKNYVAFKKKASDNKGRNQGKKANGKPKVSKSAKTA